MIRFLEASLRRLRTDYVDVFMPHFPDGTTPIEEILAWFDDLIPADRAGEAEAIAEAFVAICIGYNEQLAVRGDLDPAPITRALMAVVQP